MVRGEEEKGLEEVQKVLNWSILVILVTWSNSIILMLWPIQVMYSPLVSSSPTCSVMSYELLSRSSAPSGIGSVFQTLQYSSPKRIPDPSAIDLPDSATVLPPPLRQHPLLTSGYAIVSRPGQLMFKRSNSPEEIPGWFDTRTRTILNPLH